MVILLPGIGFEVMEYTTRHQTAREVEIEFEIDIKKF